MNTKILKFELFTLFALTISTLVVFYYRDTLPDSYLSISSQSTYGFFAYYSTSFISFINYYSGPWVFIPCAVFTSFYVLLFSKRADMIDVLNIFSLITFSLFSIYFIKPSMLGFGLFQFLDSEVSGAVMFFVTLSSLVLFLWGSFRGQFVEKVQSLFLQVKNFNFENKNNKITSLLELTKSMYSKSKQVALENFVKKDEPDINSFNESTIDKDQLQNESREVAVISSQSTAINLINDNSESVVNLPTIVSFEEEHSVIEVDDENEYVDESEISTFRPQRIDSYNDEKYYNLVKIVNHKKQETKFSQPEDKYFHDIIYKIQAKLAEFKIQGQIINVLKGPVVDTFEWELGAGERIARLTTISEDLSLALSGAPIRIVYPMKGRTTVGIEVPRNPREFIFLDEILNSKDFKETNHQLPLAMGKDAFGEANVQDLASMPHMLVAGSTGAGKSVFINSILVSLLVKKSPNQMKLILIDPKQLELALYSRLPHLLMPVITEPKTAATALLWACQEMERRYSIMSEFGVRNIEGFNHKLKTAASVTIDKIRKFYEYAADETYELPYIVIIVDEFADLMLSQKKVEIENHIARLAAKARASGIHLILATQRPSVDVITGVIKSNFPTRVSFRVTTNTDSRTILNAMGAEKLLGKGDMLYKQGVETTRIHSSYIEEAEIEALTEKLSEMAPTFNPEVLEFLENGGEEDPAVTIVRDAELGNGKDDKYDDAVRVVLEHRSASASLLQRRLGVGYNRAANLIEEMESQGVVGPAQGSKPRKVLMGSESLT
jgi:S-DNA-T family DNA segregation ATPase FtsK/SpoIIIE